MAIDHTRIYTSGERARTRYRCPECNTPLAITWRRVAEVAQVVGLVGEVVGDGSGELRGIHPDIGGTPRGPGAGRRIVERVARIGGSCRGGAGPCGGRARGNDGRQREQ
jgi:hypothetical protein